MHRFLVLSDDRFLVHAGSKPAFRIPAPRGEEIIEILKTDGYQVSKLTFGDFCEGLAANRKSLKQSTLVMPYGSFYPKCSWPSIENYLKAGGNLLSLGGCPFVCEIEKKGKVWPTGEISGRISAEELRINSYNVAGFRYLMCTPDWAEIIGYKRAEAEQPGIGIEATYVVGENQRNRDVEYPLQYADRFGSPKGNNCAIIKNYDSLFNGSTWIVAGSLTHDVAGWEQLVGAFARYIDRGGRICKLRILPLVVLQGEEVVIEYELKSPGECSDLEVDIELWDSEDRCLLLSTRRSISFTGHLTQMFREQIRTDPAWEDFVHVKLRLRAGGEEKLDFAEAGWVVAGKPSRSGCSPLALDEGLFKTGDRPTLLIGANYFVSATGLNVFKEDPPVSPLHWKRDFETMLDCGLNSVRAFIGRWRLTADGSSFGELLPERFLANVSMFHLMMKMGITPLICAHSAHTYPGRDPRVDPSVREQQKKWTEYCVKEFKGLPVLWDLENEDGIHRLQAGLEDDRTIFKPNKFLEEEWNRWMRENFSRSELESLHLKAGIDLEKDIPLPPIDKQSFDDSIERSWRYFSAAAFRNWIGTMAGSVRKVDSSIPITYSHWQDAFYEMYERWSRETNGDPWFTHDSLDFNCIHIYWYEFSEFGNELLLDPVALVKYISADSLGKPGLIGETGVTPPGNEESLADYVEEWCYALLAGGGQGVYFWTWDQHLALSLGEGHLARISHNPTKGGLRLRHYAFLTRQLNLVKQEVQVFIMVSTSAKIGGQPDRYVRCIIEAMEAMFTTGADFQLIADKDIQRLPGSAKVLIVPSPMCMNDGTWEWIRNFLNDGGNVYISGFLDRDEWRRPIKPRISELLGDEANELSADKFNVCRKKIGKGNLIFVTEAIEYLRGQQSTFLDDAEKQAAISPDSPRDFYIEIIEKSGVQMVSNAQPGKGALIFPKTTSRGRLYVIRNKHRWPYIEFQGIRISTAGEFGLVEVGLKGIILAEALSVSEGGESLIEVGSKAAGLVFSQDKEPIQFSKAIVVKLKEPGSVFVRTNASWENPIACTVRFNRSGCCEMQREVISIVNGAIILQVPDDLTEYAWLVTEEDQANSQVKRMEENWLIR